MRFAVIGDRGMFGKEMTKFLRDRNDEVRGFNRDSIDLDGSVDAISRGLDGYSVIINAVAYTSVDRAESEPSVANLVNGDYAGKLAAVSRKIGAALMHISTDYVFDGNLERPYLRNDPVNPQSAYGRSKLLGEKLVADSGANYTIFRTAWLYGKYGRCFPKVMLEKAARNEALCVVNDQFGQPTWTKDLAQQVLSYSSIQKPPNIVHAVSSGSGSWFEFAKEIVGDYPVVPVSTESFITVAKRPVYSVLDNSSDLVVPIGDWRERWQVAKDIVLSE